MRLRLTLLVALSGTLAHGLVETHSSPLPTATANSSYTFFPGFSDGCGTYYAAYTTGTLPVGLGITNQYSNAPYFTGILSTTGTYSFSVNWREYGCGSTNYTASYTLTVANPLTITTASLASGSPGTAYSQTVSYAGGAGTVALSIKSGSLPEGLTLSTAGVISGTPTTAGVYSFTVQATDQWTPMPSVQTKVLSITIATPVSVSTTSLPNGFVGLSYSQTLAASGGIAPCTWSVVSGSLPSGLSLSGAVIGGTPASTGSSTFTVQVTDSIGQTATKSLSITIGAALSITTTSLPSGVASSAYSTSLSATGGTAGYSWSLTSGSLPTGLSLNAAGTITGTPSGAGTYSFTVQATDSTSPTAQTATKSLSIAIAAALSITTASFPNGLVSSLYTQSLAATGGTSPYTWSIASGVLPPGISLSGATISGTPTTAGIHAFTIRVTDSSNPTAQAAVKDFSLTVRAALAVTTTSPLPSGLATTPYSVTLVATGGTPAYTWSLAAGAPPSGLTLSSPGVLTGTPTEATVTTFSVQVTDATTPTPQSVIKAFSITIGPALSIDTTSLPAGLQSSPYSQSLAASGGTSPYAWNLASGSLPPGLSLSGANISGTPTTPGNYTFTIRVADSTSPTAQATTHSYTITITSALAVTTSSLLSGVLGSTYSQNLVAAGGTSPYTWTMAGGALPTGLSLAPNGMIGGTTTAAGSFTFTVQATDNTKPAAQTATKTLSITVNAALSITTVMLGNAVQGQPYSVTLVATGGIAPYTWLVSNGALPAGVSLNASTGVISGTPTGAGTFSLTIRVADGAANYATRNFNLTVLPALTISTTSLSPTPAVGNHFSQILNATGGTAPYTWTVSIGTLPQGLSLDASTGTISGTPTSAGTFTFTIQVADSGSPGQTATRQFTVTVVQVLAITNSVLPNAVQGQSYSASLNGAGGVTPYSWALVSGSLPSGLSLNSTSGAISGVPATSGSFDAVVQLADSNDSRITQSLTLTVIAALSISNAALPSGSVNTPYSQPLEATGGVGPYAWSVPSGTLPPGLAITGASITGAPAATGTYTFALQVSDSGTPTQTATKNFTLVIVDPLTIVTTALDDAIQNKPYSRTLAARGGTPPYNWSIAAGALPAGLTLSSDGVITGTPTAPTTATISVLVTDASIPAATVRKDITLNVRQPLSIVTTSLPHARESTAYLQPLVASGGTPDYTWSISAGALPAGFNLAASSGTISGTGSVAGSASFGITVIDSGHPAQTASREFALVIDQAFGIDTTGTLPPGTEKHPYRFALVASRGTTPYTLSIAAGSLPAGLNLDASGDISGTPTTAGTYTFTVQAVDSATPTPRSSSADLLIVVQPQLVLIPTAMPDSVVGKSYSQPLTTAGGVAPYRWAVASGSLPSGLVLDAAGNISGVPNAAGVSTFTIKVTDSSTPNQTVSRDYTISISLNVAISTPSLADAFLGQPYQQGLIAIGGTAPYSWSVTSGALPPGLVLDSAGSINGTPTAGGSYPLTIAVADAAVPAHTASKSYSLAVRTRLTINTTSLPDGQVGLTYNQALTVSNGVAPYTWNLASGSLPPGLSLDPTGRITGTPVASGLYSFTISVTDSSSPQLIDSREFTLAITTGLRITTTSVPAAEPNASYAATFSAADGTQPYIWSIPTGTIPSGLTLDLTTGTLSGTPISQGTYTFTVQVSDAVGATANRVFSLPVGSSLVISTGKLEDARLGSMYRHVLTARNGVEPYLWTLSGGQLPDGLVLLASGEIIGQPNAAGSATFTLAVSDSALPPATASKALTLIVQPGFSITTTALPPASPGVPYLMALTAENGAAPYAFTLPLGSLPDDVTLSSSGVISGTPTRPGSYPLLIQATDSSTPATSTSRQLVFCVNTDLSITTSMLPQAFTGSAYSASLSATNGITPYTWTADSLPPGLTLLPTGEIFGTPSMAGEYEIAFTVTDSSQPSAMATRTLRLTARRDLDITTDSLPPGYAGKSYAAVVIAAGGRPSYTFRASGELPPGLSIASSGVISGTPTKAGAYTIALKVSDAAGGNAKASVVLPIGTTLTVTSASLPAGVAGTPYYAFLSAAGGTAPYVWSIDNLPDGVALIPSLGFILGTPIQAGTYSLHPTVTDSASPAHVAQAALALVIDAPLAIAPAELPPAASGSSYVATFEATGGTPPYRWAADETTLPAGLTFDTSGVLRGTVGAAPGAFTLSVCVNDSAASVARACTNRSLVVGPTFAIDSRSLPATPRGQSASYQFTVTGAQGTLSFATVFPLPSGLALSGDGLLSGIPVTSGRYTLTLIATDEARHRAARDFSLVIVPPLTVTTASLPVAHAYMRYATALTASHGTAPYTWSISAGSLPDGILLDSSGFLYGTAATTGQYPLTFVVTDSTGQPATASLTFTVALPLSILTADLSDAVVSTPYHSQLQASSGTAPYRWSLASGALPDGISLASDGLLAGTPAKSGVFDFVITVEDGSGSITGTAFTIRVVDSLAIPGDTTTLPSGTVGVTYAATLTTNYASGIVWSLSVGSLPPGLFLDSSGAITGTPTTPGTVDFIARAVSGDQCVDQLYSITIAPASVTTPNPLTLTDTALPAGITGAIYSAALAVTGGTGPYTWAVVDGQLPRGLTLIPGAITGTPSIAGIFRILVSVTDVAGQSATALYSLVIRPALTTDSLLAVDQRLGTSISLPLTAAGGTAPYTWSISSGALNPFSNRWYERCARATASTPLPVTVK